jgi:hypothetical protein
MVPQTFPICHDKKPEKIQSADLNTTRSRECQVLSPVAIDCAAPEGRTGGGSKYSTCGTNGRIYHCDWSETRRLLCHDDDNIVRLRMQLI